MMSFRAARRGVAGWAGLGMAGLGMVGRGGAWDRMVNSLVSFHAAGQGIAWFGAAGFGLAGLGRARLGRVRRGSARCGVAGHGKGPYGQVLSKFSANLETCDGEENDTQEQAPHPGLCQDCSGASATRS